MIIDAYAHFFPPKYFAKLATMVDAKQMQPWFNNPPLSQLDARLKTIEAIPDYRQVIVNSMPPIEKLGGPDITPDLARLANDGFAELCRTYPNHFAAFAAALPMDNPAAAVREIDRAVTELGARGIQIFSNVNGKPLDDPMFFEIFERMAYHDLPIWLHPVRTGEFSDYATLRNSKFAIFFTFGWPYETSVAMTHLVFSGIFDKLPKIKIIAHHMGAMIPFFEGRIGVGFDDFTRFSDDQEFKSALSKLAKHPSEYYKMFYSDTAMFGTVAGTRCGLEYFGIDHCLFGTDAPFGVPGGVTTVTDTIHIIDELVEDPHQHSLIMAENARRLLRL